MKPITIIGLSFLIAAAGTWSKENSIDKRQVIGGAFILILFAVGQEAQPKLSKDFAWLILAATAGSYGADLFGAVGKAVGDGGKAVSGKTPSTPVGTNDSRSGNKPS